MSDVTEDSLMAQGKRSSIQQPLFVLTTDLASQISHPYYDAVNKMLDAHQFDHFAEALCAEFYADKMGRPSLAPGVYFRCLMIGYLEGIDSERGIAWRCADSLSLKTFLGYAIDQSTPDHTTISRTRRLISLEAHKAMFAFFLKVLANHSLLCGKTLGVDSTPLEANAAMRSIVRRDSGEGYQEFLTRLAKESGIETPTLEDLAKLDKKRKNKASNDDWKNPHDPDAKITKMKDGSTHLAHKAEHVVDLGEDAHGAILGVNLCDASVGDTNTLVDSIVVATENLAAVADDARVADKIDGEKIASEVVNDKGYHSKQLMSDLREMNIRSYTSEPKRKDNYNWAGDTEARDALHGNRKRIKGDRGKRLLRRRGEFLERSFAHAYETGAMRRVHLRHRDNIAKRVLIHCAGFNLGLLMRVSYGMRKPRNAGEGRFCSILWAWMMVKRLCESMNRSERDFGGQEVIARPTLIALAA